MFKPAPRPAAFIPPMHLRGRSFFVPSECVHRPPTTRQFNAWTCLNGRHWWRWWLCFVWFHCLFCITRSSFNIYLCSSFLPLIRFRSHSNCFLALVHIHLLITDLSSAFHQHLVYYFMIVVVSLPSSVSIQSSGIILGLVVIPLYFASNLCHIPCLCPVFRCFSINYIIHWIRWLCISLTHYTIGVHLHPTTVSSHHPSSRRLLDSHLVSKEFTNPLLCPFSLYMCSTQAVPSSGPDKVSRNAGWWGKIPYH